MLVAGSFFPWSTLQAQSKKSAPIDLLKMPQMQKEGIQLMDENVFTISQQIPIYEEEVIALLQLDSEIEFIKKHENTSKINKETIYRKYEQYYRGVKVETGGYTVKGHISEQDSKKGMLPERIRHNIFTGINLNIEPTINEKELIDILDAERFFEKELLITPRFENEYKLVWKVIYSDPSSLIALVDAKNGEILEKYSSVMCKNAPTENHGDRNMRDWNVAGNLTRLETPGSPFQRISTYDFDNSTNLLNPSNGQIALTVADFDANLIPVSNDQNLPWNNGDADESVFQAHWMVNEAADMYKSMGIDFGILHVGVNLFNIRDVSGNPVEFPNAVALGESDLDEGWIAFGQSNNPTNTTLAEFDIVGHEMAHVYLFEHLANNLIGPASLHEGIADMFGVYMEANSPLNQGIDWAMGDDVPFIVRNLQTPGMPEPGFNCFTNVINNGSQHIRSTPLGHWFFQLVNGNAVENITSTDMEDILEVIMEGLLMVLPTADYPELRDETVLAAESMHGPCSDIYRSIVNAWDFICVPGASTTCPCDAYTQPVVSSSQVTITCPVNENLDILVTSTAPSGTSLIWSTDDDPDDGVQPKYTTFVNRTGTFYAYYYNAAFDCYSSASNPVIVDGAQAHDIQITTNTTYSSNMEIFGDIYIKNGATLTVTSTLTLASDSDIFVQDDSKLLVDGGTLTSCSDKWQGIDVAGEFDLGVLQPVTEGTLERGFVEVKNGGIIENAIIGVDTKDAYFDGKRNYVHGGGKVTITNSTIQNCDVGLRFNRFGWGSIINTAVFDEESSISGSTIQDCITGVFSEYNIGLAIINSTFDDNTSSDYLGFSSKITANGTTFSNFTELGGLYPATPGSRFFDNDFEDAFLVFGSLGNFSKTQINKNVFDGDLASVNAEGEIFYEVVNNDFDNCFIGSVSMYTGENTGNFIRDNAFANNIYGAYVGGENDIEYLTNCFDLTGEIDIEIFGSNSSIHIQQGRSALSAGNCFYQDGIETSSSTESFTYWTKDGFYNGNPPQNPNCKYPGIGNFNIELAQNENDHTECGTGQNLADLPIEFVGIPCYGGINGCKQAITEIEDSITTITNNATLPIDIKNRLIAKYTRNLDELMRTEVDSALNRGDVSGTLTYLSARPEFRYRIMAYGILNNNLDYDRAEAYIDTLSTSKTEEQDFVSAQQIYLDYMADSENYQLSNSDSTSLRTIGESGSPYSGYARSIFYSLVGERIAVTIEHLDGSVEVRSSEDIEELKKKEVQNIRVFPNPTNQNFVQIVIDDYTSYKEYEVKVFDSFGRVISNKQLTGQNEQVEIGTLPGMYFIYVQKGNEVLGINRIIRL